MSSSAEGRKKESNLCYADKEAKAPCDGDVELTVVAISNYTQPQHSAGFIRDSDPDSEFSKFKKSKQWLRKVSYEEDLPKDISDDRSEHSDDESEFSDDESEPCPITNLPEIHCEMCNLVHSLFDFCYPCEACQNSYTHTEHTCSYIYYLPRGAEFNRQRYDVYCECGSPFFDTVNWVCTAKFCGGPVRAKLVIKECEICSSYGDHNTFDCLVDKERAALCKAEMEKYYQWPGLKLISIQELREQNSQF